ncbi:MAG TPA: hypothetical protein VFY90_04510 [Tepidiformaceae bacterium]|nr:hypothetical protein [Tepidiformaceae bacterium]
MPKALLILMALLALAVPALASCGGDDDDDSSTTPVDSKDDTGKTSSSVVDTKGGGECEVKVTGDLDVSWKGNGGVEAVGSDYWLSDKEFREAFELIATGSKDEKQKQVDEAMNADPRLFILIVNCIPKDDSDVSLIISPSNAAKYADVPFKPAEYAVGEPASDDPKEFSVLLFTGGEELWKVDEGTLKLTRWDKKGVAGSVKLKAEEFFAEGTPKKVTVEGSFDFDCFHGANCEN